MSEYQQNPFILEFCYQLIARKMNPDEMDAEKIDKLVDSLYSRLESKLGRNIVEYLPAKKREEIKKEMADVDLQKDSDTMEKVASAMSAVSWSAQDFQKILKFTLQELSDEFLNS